jgi:streptogrisin C
VKRELSVVAAMVAASSLLTVSPVFAEETLRSPSMLTAMARDLGLTTAQAEELMARDARASHIEQVLRARLGADFGGAHIDADGQLVVNVVNDEHAAVVRAEGATARPARFRAAELDAAVADLNGNPKHPSDVPGWYTDAVTNQVVVEVNPGSVEAAHRFVADSGVAADKVVFVETTHRPVPLIDVIGGNAYRTGSGRCSIGFPTSSGFITAGHCGEEGATTTDPSGTVTGSKFPGNDWAYVETNSGNTSKPLVNKYDGSNVTVAGSSEASDGAKGCRSGSTTQWHCGTLQSRNATVNYPEGSVTGMIKTSICAEPGDSGGSMIAGTQAQGVTSGGSGDCDSGGTTYFQPIGPAMSALGVSILTG